MTGNAVQYVEGFLIVPAVQIIGCRLKPDGILILVLILVGALLTSCLLYTSDAADDSLRGRSVGTAIGAGGTIAGTGRGAGT